MSHHRVEIIDADEIHDWVEKCLQPLLPDKHISILPSKYGACVGESRWSCDVDVYKAVSLETLLMKEVKEYSRGNYVHFYVDDILSAMYASGALEAERYRVEYSW